VLRVVDGDTVVVSIGGRPERVRLLGIDTPEVAREGRPGEPFARAAVRFTRSRLAQARGVELEVAGDRVDDHGRTLGFLWLREPGRAEPSNLSEELLRAGLARALRRFDYPGKARFLALEAQARRDGLGLWRAPR
ncbi:MAG: thermonuclease family protein, partial [Deferrisomatales bacterium]